LLTVVSLPLGSTTPGAALDRSWQLGLSLAHVEGLHFGRDIVFTYGPLGFLAAPSAVFGAGEFLGIIYAGVTAFALYFVVFSWVRRWTPLLPAAGMTFVFSVAATHVGTVPNTSPIAAWQGVSPITPELGALALVLAALRLVEPSGLPKRLPPIAAAVLGLLAALQIQVKFSVGVFFLAVALVVTASRGGRVRNIGILTASFVVGFLALWLASGQALGDLAAWIRASIAITVGYGAAMAYGSGPALTRVWLILVPGVLALVAFAVVLFRRSKRASIPAILLLASGAWFFLKEGFIRLDYFHYPLAYLAFSAALAVVPLRRWWRGLTAAGVIFYALATIWLTPAYVHPTIAEVVSSHRAALTHLVDAARDRVDQRYRASRLETAASEIRAFHNVAPLVSTWLLDSRVHADPWDIAAVWAYGLRWQPDTIFQTYQANQPSLDHLNARHLLDADGPDAILQRPQAIDGRFALWESPSYIVTMACNYWPLAQDQLGWVALRRGDDRCGPSRLIATDTLQPGQAGTVPSPSQAASLVVATFDYPTGIGESLLDTFLKPVKIPLVVIEGASYRFVTGTASDEHLMSAPAGVGGHALAEAPLHIHTIGFPSAASSVTVRYFEIPLNAVLKPPL
jgi:hypothetical protein